jgi:outer membrane protein OmpA-like peptidoglycan-associated protein
MEPRFGHDFSQVRIHTNSSAAESARTVNAFAYTVGQDIVFNTGNYAPHTLSGLSLLTHELVHTVQQKNIPGFARSDLQVAPNNDVHEREAQQKSALISHGKTHFTTASPSIQRACGPPAVGSVGGCVGVGGQDIFDLGVDSNSLYLFNVNCDEFLPGEDARLRSFASTITPEQTVEIHGFASEEGDAIFNDNLSCARALAATDILLREGVAVSPTIFKHGGTPGDRPAHRSVVILVKDPILQQEEQPTPVPSSTYVACYDGSTVYVNKNGSSHHCAAITGTVGGPTPDGEYCIREQGAAQLGRTLRHPLRDHSDWYLLEPQFSTTRFRMHLHPGSASAGCVTVTNSPCFDTLAGILNRSGRMTRDGFDGYPPGNSEGVTNPKAPKTCVGLLLVRRRVGGCSFMTGSRSP